MEMEKLRSEIMEELKKMENAFNSSISDLKRDSFLIKQALLGNEDFDTKGFKQRVDEVEHEVISIRESTRIEIENIKKELEKVSINKDIKMLLAIASGAAVSFFISWLFEKFSK